MAIDAAGKKIVLANQNDEIKELPSATLARKKRQ